MITAILTSRATALTTFWTVAVAGSFLSVISVVLDIAFRSAWFWRAAVAMIVTTLGVAVGAAVVDRLGYAW